MAAYYNEIDPYAAAWLRNLIAAGHIAPGDVDERSITDVRADDLRGYTQCHFFAGIGGWSLALRLAGWGDDRAVWTGSCPCQPFSVAGKREGAADERHLWPAWFRLIAECRPGKVFGEQVEGAVRLGWLDGVFADLEGEGYACGAAVLGAHSVGAPHIRQRLWFVADAMHAGRAERRAGAGERQVAGGGVARILADRIGAGLEGQPARPLGDERATAERGGAAGVVAQPDEGQRGPGRPGCGSADSGRECGELAGPSFAGQWTDCEGLPCRDGKARPVEPGTFPLAHGVPGRVGRLRAYGNAIVPQAGAAFVGAWLDAERQRLAVSLL